MDYHSKLQVFSAWLAENGAKYPKIDWPSDDTVGGCRGAMAVETISSDEVMMEIPIKLMMSPNSAFDDELIGKKLQMSQDILRGDILLAVYIMSEILKGEGSFYHPFLAILPESGSIIQWTDSQLGMLQDDSITHRAKNRRVVLRNTYSRSIEVLCDRYPETFTVEEYTYKLFLFSWFSIQARAFGRRLPWTALVPFADCLNHSNVQTKYDYNINNNGVFRMYPTGSNCYPQGTEVFNSYGRRPNDNLLLDYGFSILDNMWDDVQINLSLSVSTPMYGAKRSILFAMGKNPNHMFNFQRASFPFEALAFSRVVCMEEKDLNIIMEQVDESDNTNDEESAATQTFLLVNRIINITSELAAIRLLSRIFCEYRIRWLTTILEDEMTLQVLETPNESTHIGVFDSSVKKIEINNNNSDGSTDDENWKAISSLKYRLTRKRIIDSNIQKLFVMESHFSSLFERGTGTDQKDQKETDISPSKMILEKLNQIDTDSDGKKQLSEVSPYVTSASRTFVETYKSEDKNGSANDYKLRAYIQRACNDCLTF